MVLYFPRNSIVVASLNPAHSFAIRNECSFRESCPRKLAHSLLSYLKRALNLARVSLMTARLLEYYSSQI